jgi:acid phosphatase type 7
VNSYLRFSVSGMSGTVQSATLRLWVQASGGTQDGPFVRATGTNWSETGITWRNRPGTSGDVLDDKGALSNGTWVEYTVTRAVKGNGAVGFVLRPESNDGAIFDSREGANKPQLVITSGSGTPAPTPTPTPTPGPNPTPTPTPTPPTGTTATLLAAGDIAGCSTSGDEATAKLLDGLAGTIATLGDNVYDSGTASEFSSCYDPSWGRHKSRTKPATGNHDYLTSGASGYFGYFSPQVQSSYYSYTLGSWHIVVLNSNCSQAGGCGVGSPQETWLKNDLAAHPTTCTLAYWHHPHFSFGNYSTDTRMQALWQALDAAGAELVLSGHDHNYQRWAPQTWSGTRDPARGIREFVVGTGGKNHYPLGSPPANVEQSNDDTFGILQLTLRPTSYDWKFVPEAGKTFTDTGSGMCH